MADGARGEAQSRPGRPSGARRLASCARILQAAAALLLALFPTENSLRRRLSRSLSAFGARAPGHSGSRDLTPDCAAAAARHSHWRTRTRRRYQWCAFVGPVAPACCELRRSNVRRLCVRVYLLPIQPGAFGLFPSAPTRVALRYRCLRAGPTAMPHGRRAGVRWLTGTAARCCGWFLCD